MTTRGGKILVAICAVSAAFASPAFAESGTFTVRTPITFSGQNTDSQGSSFPSGVPVSGLEGPITDVNLTVSGIDMSHLGQLHLLLVAPSGEAEVAMRVACTSAVQDRTITFDQQAASILAADCAGDSYKPTDLWGGAPAYGWPEVPDAATKSSNFDNFNNENANGRWSLYAYRYCNPEFTTCPASGDQVGEWSLSIQTGSYFYDLPGGGTGVTLGPSLPYGAFQSVTGEGGIVNDVNVRIDGIFHNKPSDIDMVLERVSGPKVMLMSDACGSFDVNAYGWVWDDEADATMPVGGDTNVCGVTAYRPTNAEPGESLPLPAPSAPYSGALSSFDGLTADGAWRLWIADDASNGEGFFTHDFDLQFSTRAAAKTGFASAAADVPEATVHELVINRTALSNLGPGSLEVSTHGVTAQSPSDYQGMSAHVVDFARGEVEERVPLTVLSDELTEEAETLEVRLADPSGDVRLTGSKFDPSPITTKTVTIPANAAPEPDPGPGTDPNPTPDPDPGPGSGPGPDPYAEGPVETDTAAPQTTITKAPRKKSRKRRATVKFGASEPGAGFECKLDRRRFKPCTSPLKLRRLRPGKHRLLVRATDLAGNADPTPARARWKVRRPLTDKADKTNAKENQ